MAFVVNPAAATHSVDDERVELLLAEGFRQATPDEVVAWHEAQGLEVPAELKPKREPRPVEPKPAAEPKAEKPKAAKPKADEQTPPAAE